MSVVNFLLLIFEIDCFLLRDVKDESFHFINVFVNFFLINFQVQKVTICQKNAVR